MADNIKALFDKHDENKDGSISAHELKNVVKEMDLPWTNKLVHALIRERQRNADGKMDLDDFTRVIKALEEIRKALRNPDETNDAMVAAFNKIDKNGDGLLSNDELKEGMAGVVGIDLSSETIAELVKAADANSDGQVDIKEFAQMVTSFF